MSTGGHAAWTPYVYAALGGTQIEPEERDLVEAGRIRALGFIYVDEN